MAGTTPAGLRHVENCADYQTYVATIDTDETPSQYASMKQSLMRIGNCEPERMGVVYVRGPWGFLVIPGPGFPELRISFYHDTPVHDRNAVLASIATAVHESCAGS